MDSRRFGIGEHNAAGGSDACDIRRQQDSKRRQRHANGKPGSARGDSELSAAPNLRRERRRKIKEDRYCACEQRRWRIDGPHQSGWWRWHRSWRGSRGRRWDGSGSRGGRGRRRRTARCRRTAARSATSDQACSGADHRNCEQQGSAFHLDLPPRRWSLRSSAEMESQARTQRVWRWLPQLACLSDRSAPLSVI